MPELCEEVCFILLHHRIRSRNHQIIHIQFSITHIQGSSTESSDVILKGCKFSCDLVWLLTEALQLLGNGLCRSDLVSLLSAVCHHLVYNFIKTL